eukprot:7453062-Pyramimonas_sp.AAC.1
MGANTSVHRWAAKSLVDRAIGVGGSKMERQRGWRRQRRRALPGPPWRRTGGCPSWQRFTEHLDREAGPRKPSTRADRAAC